MASLVHAGILHHSSLERALSYRIAQKLASPEMSDLILREIVDEAYQDDPAPRHRRRAPTSSRCSSAIPPATATCSRCCSSRASRRCSAIGSGTGSGSSAARTWPTSSRCGPRRSSGSTSIPGARMGNGRHDRPRPFDRDRRDRCRGRQCLDASLGDPRRDRQGGWRSASQDRRRRADRRRARPFSATSGSGGCSRIAAGSVVLQDVPPCKTVAGVPAHVVGEAGCAEPSKTHGPADRRAGALG